jgi:hypothetical protein
MEAVDGGSLLPTTTTTTYHYHYLPLPLLLPTHYPLPTTQKGDRDEPAPLCNHVSYYACMHAVLNLPYRPVL